MKKLLSLILSAAMLCTTVGVVSADDYQQAGEMSETRTVKVGINAEYVPFEYYENDELTGFDVDLMNNISSRTGYVVEYVDMPFEELIMAVASGDIDCAISAITATEERDEIVDFSREYLKCRTYTKDDDGVKHVESTEKYAIAFREGVKMTKYMSRTPNEYEEMYMAIDDAVRDLSQDGTVRSLMKKYGLGISGNENTGYITEYSDVVGHGVKPNVSGTTGISASEWAVESVEKARKIGITNYGGNYNYPGNITREEFCELIYNYYTLISDGPTAVYVKNPFKDTDNEHITILNALDIIKGKSETEFAPNDLLTREEAAAIIFRLIKTVHSDWAATELWFDFADEGDISDWSMDSIQRVCNMGIMKGVGDSKFAPKSNFTAEQAIATLVRCYENFNRSEIIGGGEEDFLSRYIDKKALTTLGIQVENPFISDDRTLILNDSIDNEIELFIYDYYKNIMTGSYQKVKDVIAGDMLLGATENEENNFKQGIYYSQILIKNIEIEDEVKIGGISAKKQWEITDKLSDFQTKKFAVVSIECNIKHNEKSFSTVPQVGDGDITRYYLIGKIDDGYKILEVYWEGFLYE